MEVGTLAAISTLAASHGILNLEWASQWVAPDYPAKWTKSIAEAFLDSRSDHFLINHYEADVGNFGPIFPFLSLTLLF